MAIDVAALKASITLDGGDFTRGMADVRQQLQDTQQEADRTSTSFENLGKVIDDLKTRSIIGMGRSLSIAITAPLVLLGRELLDSAVKVDAWKRGLNSMTGSIAATRQEMQELVEVSKLPGLTFEGAMKGSIALQATGVSAEQAKRELMAYGNALAAVGRGAPEMEQVIRQLTHIHSLTYLSNREIRSLSINIPQFREQMLLRFGTASGQDLKEQGITAADAMKGMLEQFEKMPRVTSSARNEIDNFFSSLFRSAAKVGESLVPVVVILMHQVAPAVESVANWFSHLSDGMKIGIVTFGLLAAAVGPPIFVMGLFLRSIQDIRVGLQSMVALGGAVGTWWRGLTVATVENTSAEVQNAAATEAETVAKAREAEVVGAKTGVLRTNTVASEANTVAEEANTVATAANAAVYKGWRIEHEAGSYEWLSRELTDPSGGHWTTAEGIAAQHAMEASGVHPSWFGGGAAAMAAGGAGIAGGAVAAGSQLAPLDPARFGAWGAAGAAGAAGVAGAGLGASFFAGSGNAVGNAAGNPAAIPAYAASLPPPSGPFDPISGAYIGRPMAPGGYPVGDIRNSMGWTRAAPGAALGSRAIPAMVPILLALGAHMAKESMEEKDTNSLTAKHGLGGFVADIATGALPGGLIGGAIGTMIAPGAGTLIGAGIGAIIGGGIGAYRFISGEGDRVKRENAQRERETSEAAAAESRNRAMRKQLEDLMKPPPPDFEGSQDAAYHAYLAQARAGAREEYSQTPQQAQLDATGGIMRQRQDVLKQRMQALLPSIEKDPDDAKAYYKASQEAWTIEDQLSKMQVAAVKERETLQRKAFHDQKEIQDAQFRAAQYAAQAIGQAAPEGMRAQTYAGLAQPLVAGRQAELISEAKRLLPNLGKDVDQTKEYWSIVQEYWQLEEHQQALVKAGVDERKQFKDKAEKLARETHIAAIEAQIEWATSQAANAAPGHMHGKELEVLLPVIQQQEKEMIEEIQKTTPGSLQYFKLVKDYWALEKRDQDIVRNAKQEADNEGKKTRHEQLQVMELREKLLEGIGANDPLTDDKTAKRRMVPLLLAHYKELLAPIQGETEIERLQREIEAQTVKKRLIDAAGINRKAYASTIDGGRIPLFDLGAARQLDAQLRGIEGGAQDAMLRDAMGLSPGAGGPGASSGKKIANPWAGRYHRDFDAEDAWKQKAANIYRDDVVVDARSGHYGPTWPQEARSMAQMAAGDKPIVFQIVVAPGASRAERERAIRETIERYANELDPSPSVR